MMHARHVPMTSLRLFFADILIIDNGTQPPEVFSCGPERRGGSTGLQCFRPFLTRRVLAANRAVLHSGLEYLKYLENLLQQPDDEEDKRQDQNEVDKRTEAEGEQAQRPQDNQDDSDDQNNIEH
jgi:hypothetical protein